MSPSVVKRRPARTKPKPDSPEEELPMEQEPMDQTSLPVVVPNRFAEVLADIRAKSQITLDNGESVEFDEELKEEFLGDVERSFPVVQKMVANLYETGMFFKEVRDRQKPKKLWLAYSEAIGMPRRTLQTYIQVVERFGDEVTRFSFLGVTKLMLVSRLKEPVKYVESHTEDIARTSTRELLRLVIEEVNKARKIRTGKKKGKKQKFIETSLAGVKMLAAANGQSLKVLGLNKELQAGVIEAVKEYISLRK